MKHDSSTQVGACNAPRQLEHRKTLGSAHLSCINAERESDGHLQETEAAPRGAPCRRELIDCSSPKQALRTTPFPSMAASAAQSSPPAKGTGRPSRSTVLPSRHSATSCAMGNSLAYQTFNRGSEGYEAPFYILQICASYHCSILLESASPIGVLFMLESTLIEREEYTMRVSCTL